LATALLFLVWYLFAPQYALTLAVIRQKIGKWTWKRVTFGSMLALAYLGFIITYQTALYMGAG
jgi:ferrous iron transport protein B